MGKDSILVGVIGLLIGVVIAGFAAGQAVNNNHTGMMRMMGMNTNKTATASNAMSMADMTTQLKDKTGDDFDKAFIDMMIKHHQGAIDMAKLVPERAKHQEIKTLGEAIISAQSKEINDMQQWQMDWGYVSGDNLMPGMNH